MRDKSIFLSPGGNDSCHIPKSIQIHCLTKAGAVSMHTTYDRESTRRRLALSSRRLLNVVTSLVVKKINALETWQDGRLGVYLNQGRA